MILVHPQIIYHLIEFEGSPYLSQQQFFVKWAVDSFIVSYSRVQWKPIRESLNLHNQFLFVIIHEQKVVFIRMLRLVV